MDHMEDRGTHLGPLQLSPWIPATAAVGSEEGDATTQPKGAVPVGYPIPLRMGLSAGGRRRRWIIGWEQPWVKGEKFRGGGAVRGIPPLGTLERVHKKQAEPGG